MSDTTKPVPSPKLSISIGETPVVLFMSFGLLDKLLNYIAKNSATGGAESVVFEEVQRNEILKIVLQKRGDYGYYTVENPFDIDTAELTSETVSIIFGWVLEHSTDFFLRNAEVAQAVTEKYQTRVASLAPSQTGSQP